VFVLRATYGGYKVHLFKFSVKVLGLALTVLSMVGALIMGGCTTPVQSQESEKRMTVSAQYSDGKFFNEESIKHYTFERFRTVLMEIIFNVHQHSSPSNSLPVNKLDIKMLTADGENTLQFSRLGHSTVLIKMGSKIWLTDPMFSERASPVQWFGPQRFHELPIEIADLPEIEGVVISHNHYDHLDYQSIISLIDKVNKFYVPLGVKSTLVKWGIDKRKVIELDWWQSYQVGEFEVVSTPSRHFSGRGIMDANTTLWSSWVIKNKTQSIYFSGDTGYFAGFKDIGDRLGPFDIAFMETGAYHPKWPDIHMLPEHSIQAFKDVQGKLYVPIHNGTFDLSTHAWYEPFEKISLLAKKSNIRLVTPMFGEVLSSNDGFRPSNKSRQWWKLKHNNSLL